MTWLARPIASNSLVMTDPAQPSKGPMEPSAEEAQYFAKDGGTEGLVHVFDFDYQRITDYDTALQCRREAACPFCLPCWFLCGKQNVIDEVARLHHGCTPVHRPVYTCTYTQVKAQHVCITHDGIRYIVDKHPSACRLEFQTVGKTTKTGVHGHVPRNLHRHMYRRVCRRVYRHVYRVEQQRPVCVDMCIAK